MVTTISATELKNRLSEILNSVYYNQMTIIIERHGKPLVKIVPIDDIKDKWIKTQTK